MTTCASVCRQQTTGNSLVTRIF